MVSHLTFSYGINYWRTVQFESSDKVAFKLHIQCVCLMKHLQFAHVVNFHNFPDCLTELCDESLEYELYCFYDLDFNT